MVVSRGAGPPPSTEADEWPSRPVYLCAHPDIQTRDYEPGAPLPLNDLIEFESELFVGILLVRLKPLPPKDEEEGQANGKNDASTTKTKLQSHEEYFQKTCAHFQILLQGRFKEEILFSDLCQGDCYDKPFKGVPKGLFRRLWEKYMESMYPLTVMNLAAENPVLFSPLGSTQLMRVDLPGDEPDLTRHDVVNNLQEETTLLFADPIAPPKKPPREGTATSSSRRRGHLSKAKHAVNYKTNPDHVYTIEYADDSMCYATHYQFALGFKIDVPKAMNGQPTRYSIMRKSDSGIVCKFPIWHERLIVEMRKAEESISANDDPTKESNPGPDRVEHVDIWHHNA